MPAGVHGVTISPDDLYAAFVGAGGLAGLHRLVMWWSSRRVQAAQADDLQASASQRLAEAAAGVVEQTASVLPGLTAQVARLDEQVASQARALDRQRQDSARLWSWLERHQTWDLKAIQAINDLGGHLDPPEPPPAPSPAN